MTHRTVKLARTLLDHPADYPVCVLNTAIRLINLNDYRRYAIESLWVDYRSVVRAYTKQRSHKRLSYKQRLQFFIDHGILTEDQRNDFFKKFSVYNDSTRIPYSDFSMAIKELEISMSLLDAKIEDLKSLYTEISTINSGGEIGSTSDFVHWSTRLFNKNLLTEIILFRLVKKYFHTVNLVS